jgi:hypothetical protein
VSDIPQDVVQAGVTAVLAFKDAQIAELRTAMERMEANDRRYRWLYMKATQRTAYDVYGVGGMWQLGIHSEDNRLSFSEAIDAAMKEKGK